MIEVMFLVFEGCALFDIDVVVMLVGFLVGFIILMDEVGIDVGVKVI